MGFNFGRGLAAVSADGSSEVASASTGGNETRMKNITTNIFIRIN